MVTNNRNRLDSLFPKDSGRYLVTPGIHTNLTVTASYVETDKYQAIKLAFVNEDGDTFSKLCFKPTKGYPKVIEGEDGIATTESEEDALFRAENEALSHLARLAHLANANLLQSFDDFAEMAKHLIGIVNSEKEHYNIKLVLDKNDKYLDLGRYANSSIELYKAGKSPNIKVNPKDNMGTASHRSDLDLDSPGESNSDLPF